MTYVLIRTQSSNGYEPSYILPLALTANLISHHHYPQHVPILMALLQHTQSYTEITQSLTEKEIQRESILCEPPSLLSESLCNFY